MQDDALIRKGLASGQWVLPLAIGVLAVLIGVVVGQGGWFFLPAVALLPLLWFWPVEVAVDDADELRRRGSESCRRRAAKGGPVARTRARPSESLGTS